MTLTLDGPAAGTTAAGTTAADSTEMDVAADVTDVDAVVIGGGFYGSCIARHLVRERGLREVVLLERESGLMRRASYNNQARVHNGYHYPRSFTTAYRSRVNLPRFLADWPQAIRRDFVKVYALARRGSQTNQRQFTAFCKKIGAPALPLRPQLRDLFDPRTVEAAFEVEEWAFDSTVLAAWARTALHEVGVQVRTATQALSLHRDGDRIRVLTSTGVPGTVTTLRAPYVFNCTYSRINTFGGDFAGVALGLKHEVTEMALVQVPPELAGLGVTVMDGPFFSLMPFPPRGLHTLSHVRYTPHRHWTELPGHPGAAPRPVAGPVAGPTAEPGATSRADRMIRDARRYLPAVAGSRYVDSLVEVKTVLLRNERDDGRPILFERHTELPGLFSVLGGKIDNIYDVLERLDAEQLSPPTAATLGN